MKGDVVVMDDYATLNLEEALDELKKELKNENLNKEFIKNIAKKNDEFDFIDFTINGISIAMNFIPTAGGALAATFTYICSTARSEGLSIQLENQIEKAIELKLQKEAYKRMKTFSNENLTYFKEVCRKYQRVIDSNTCENRISFYNEYNHVIRDAFARIQNFNYEDYEIIALPFFVLAATEHLILLSMMYYYSTKFIPDNYYIDMRDIKFDMERVIPRYINIASKIIEGAFKKIKLQHSEDEKINCWNLILKYDSYITANYLKIIYQWMFLMPEIYGKKVYYEMLKPLYSPCIGEINARYLSDRYFSKLLDYKPLNEKLTAIEIHYSDTIDDTQGIIEYFSKGNPKLIGNTTLQKKKFIIKEDNPLISVIGMNNNGNFVIAFKHKDGLIDKACNQMYPYYDNVSDAPQGYEVDNIYRCYADNGIIKNVICDYRPQNISNVCELKENTTIYAFPAVKFLPDDYYYEVYQTSRDHITGNLGIWLGNNLSPTCETKLKFSVRYDLLQYPTKWEIRYFLAAKYFKPLEGSIVPSITLETYSQQQHHSVHITEKDFQITEEFKKRNSASKTKESKPKLIILGREGNYILVSGGIFDMHQDVKYTVQIEGGDIVLERIEFKPVFE